MALEDTLEIDRENKNIALSSVLGTNTVVLSYIATRGIESDRDKNGNVILGSKRKKTISAITSLGLGREQTLMLITASGYSLQDNDIKGLSAQNAKNLLLKYILNLKGLSKADKAEIAEICGFKVVNGNISTK